LIEVIIGVGAIFGLLTAIAIPHFLEFQAGSNQGEAKATVKAMFSAQRAFSAEAESRGWSVGSVFHPSATTGPSTPPRLAAR
jgi:type IV pilus assembly protein PilA